MEMSRDAGSIPAASTSATLRFVAKWLFYWPVAAEPWQKATLPESRQGSVQDPLFRLFSIWHRPPNVLPYAMGQRTHRPVFSDYPNHQARSRVDCQRSGGAIRHVNERLAAQQMKPDYWDGSVSTMYYRRIV